MGNVKVSAVIKAKNEARQILDCLRSLEGFADEVVVVNDVSTDATAELAHSLGARVIEAESRDGVIDELDKIGFEAASGEWLLRMDADERMTPTLAGALMDAARSGSCAGVRYARKNMMFGRWARYGGWFKNDQLRFFRADAWDKAWEFQDLHSQVPVRGRIIDLPLREEFATIHLDYGSIQQFVDRSLVKYVRAEALVAYQQGRRCSVGRMLLKPARRFLGRYFLRQGFRDGLHGALLAGLLAVYDFCIEAHLWDLQQRGGREKI